MNEKEYVYTLQLNSNTEEKLLFQFNKMNAISQEILKILLENKKYEIKSDVSKDVFHIFSQYLNDGKNPEINGDNLFELSLLANEFKLNDLLSIIKIKSTKWHEYEKHLEQQEQINSELQKNIQQLTCIIQELSNKINQLENQQNLSNQNNHQQEIETKIQELKDKIDEHKNCFDSKIEQILNTHLESCQNQISSNREKQDELRNLLNEKTTLLSSKIDSLTPSFDTKLQNYITRNQLRNIFSVGQTSYSLSSYGDYSKWYFTPQGRAAQIDGNHGHALIAWGWKKALELI